MPKLKTNSSAKKRFSFTATGKVRRAQANRRHLLTGKRTKVKRKLRAPAIISQVDLPALRRLLPYG